MVSLVTIHDQTNLLQYCWLYSLCVHYIHGSYLSYSWKFVPLNPLHLFHQHPQPFLSGSLQFVLRSFWKKDVCAQSCPTLCNPMDCSPPGFSARGISQARILGWVAISFSRGSSPSKDQTCISCIDRQISLPLSHLGSPLQEGLYFQNRHITPDFGGMQSLKGLAYQIPT